MLAWIEENPDFTATVQFRSAEHGGRHELPRQGYRCDFQYEDDPADQAWMIYPCFLDQDGRPIAQGAAVPSRVGAHFRVLDRQLRATEHARRLRVGTRFSLVEGARRVADGTVTHLLAIDSAAG